MQNIILHHHKRKYDFIADQSILNSFLTNIHGAMSMVVKLLTSKNTVNKIDLWSTWFSNSNKNLPKLVCESNNVLTSKFAKNIWNVAFTKQAERLF